MKEDPPQLRVVHVASGRQWRGGQRQVLLLARELAALGVDQVVVTSAAGRLARDLEAAAVRVHPVAWRSGLALGALRAAWREARPNGTILHAHDGHAVTLAGVAAALARRPFVATRRTAFPLRRPAIWKRAAQVVAVSQATRARLIDGGVRPDRVVVVPSGIDLDAARSAAAQPVRERLGLPATARLAVNVAAFTREKDHDTLIAAAAASRDRLPHVHWLLAGDGPLRPQIERAVRNHGLESRIHLLGWVDEPLGVIAAADVFVLTSLAEGVGTVLLDALARRIPAVATRVGGVPETVGEGALLVEPGDPEGVARAVERVLGDPDLQERLAAGGEQAVARRSAAGMANALLGVYRSVLLKP